MHKSFKQHGLVPSEFGYAIIDPGKAEKVARDARKFKGKAVVQLCTYSRESIDELVKFCEEIGCEEIFSEALNSRAKGLEYTQKGLTENGYLTEANMIESIGQKSNWSKYAFELIRNVQSSVREHSDISKLKFLLYPKGLLFDHRNQIEKDDAGIKWL